MIDGARLAMANSREDIGDVTTSLDFDLEHHLAPHRAETVVNQLAVVHGPDAALAWGQMLLHRTEWSSRRRWEWWPVRVQLALIQAAAGRVEDARAASQGWLPLAYGLAVAAAIELADGKLETARQLADEVLRTPGAPHRLSLLVSAIKAACVGSPADIEALAVAEDWSHALDVLALAPEVVRRSIVERLDANTEGLRGLAVEQVEQPSLRLTKRQVEILEHLASDATLREIAETLVIGRETVRSTAKDIYRRLGVAERAAAVAKVRSLGLI